MFKLIGLIISFGTLAAFILSYGNGITLFDGSAALIMFGVFFGGVIFGYGNNIFRLIKLSREERIKSLDLFVTLDFYNYLSKLTYISSVIALLFSAVILLANNQDPASFGTALALTLLTCLYGVILSTLVIQPLKHGVLYKNMNTPQPASTPVKKPRPN